jgi:hypothetical protein
MADLVLSLRPARQIWASTKHDAAVWSGGGFGLSRGCSTSAAGVRFLHSGAARPPVLAFVRYLFIDYVIAFWLRACPWSMRRGRLRRGRLCHQIWTAHRLVRGLGICLRLQHLPRFAAGSLRRFSRRRRSFLWRSGFCHHFGGNSARGSGRNRASMRKHRGHRNFGQATAAVRAAGAGLGATPENRSPRSGQDFCSLLLSSGSESAFKGCLYKSPPLGEVSAFRFAEIKPQSLSRTLAKTARNISCVNTPVLVL